MPSSRVISPQSLLSLLKILFLGVFGELCGEPLGFFFWSDRPIFRPATGLNLEL
jgi:hypothetical protein